MGDPTAASVQASFTYSIWLNDNFTGLRFRSSNNITFDFTTPKDLEMRHYALVADGAGNLSLYLNGRWAQTLTGNTSFLINTIGKAYPTTTLHYKWPSDKPLGGPNQLHGFNDETLAVNGEPNGIVD